MHYKRIAVYLATVLVMTGCAVSSNEPGLEITSTDSVALTVSTTDISTTATDMTASTIDSTESIAATEASTENGEGDAGTDEAADRAVFSVKGGAYAEEVHLNISDTKGRVIYYTTDGSDPRSSLTRLVFDEELILDNLNEKKNVVSAVDPILFDTDFVSYNRKEKTFISNLSAPDDSAVDKCHVIKAVCENDDKSFSEVYSQTYFIGNITEHIQGIENACEAMDGSLAVISITADYDDFFDYDTGIYVKGASFDKSFEKLLNSGETIKDDSGRKLLANYSQRGREWEREVYVDIYEYSSTSSANVISQSCGLRIQGNYSRSDLQKGFRLYARDDYGNKKFKSELFSGLCSADGQVIDSFKTITLRNGGNCAFSAKYNDAYWQSLITDMDLSTKASRPAVVYLNGEYWGLYIMEEDYSSEYFEDHYNVKDDNVVLYKGDAESYQLGYKLDLGKIPEGEKETYYFNELLSFFKTHKNLSDEASYEEFSELVDIESVKDYFAVEIWVNNKWDWPGKNWSMWKSIGEKGEGYNDGRWRFCVYDIEFGGVCGGSEASANTIKEDNYKTYGLLDFGTDNPAVLCFAYLMTNEGFRNDFYKKLNSLTDNNFAITRADEMLKKFESIYSPLLTQFYERYPGTGSVDEAMTGGYSSSKCIREFLNKRPAYIQKMIDYAEKIENR